MRRPRLLLPWLALLALLVAGCGGDEPAGAEETEIAFVSTRDGDYAIFGMRADGSGEGRLSPEQEGPISQTATFFQLDPTWSPDGKQIAFASRRSGRSHIFVMSADGTGTRQLTSGKHNDATPSWSPDGRTIAFARNDQLFGVGPDGRDPKRITTALGGEEREPAWSPDGEWLSFVRREPGFSSREIWRVRRDGTGAERVTRLNAASYGPSWSTDGKRIVFTSNAKDDRYLVYEIGADGKGLRRLTFQPGEYFDPSWSKHGKTLMFERDGTVYTLVLGEPEEALTEGPNDGSPAWRPVVPATG